MSRPQASTSPSRPTQLKQQVLSSSCTSSYSGPFSGGRSLEAKCLSGGLGHHLAEVLLAWVSLAHLVPLLPCSPPLPSSWDFSWVCLVNVLQKKMKILSPGKQKGKGHCKQASNYCSSEPYIVTFFRQQGHDFKFLSPWCSWCSLHSWFLFAWKGGHQVHSLFQCNWCSWYSRCRWFLLSWGVTRSMTVCKSEEVCYSNGLLSSFGLPATPVAQSSPLGMEKLNRCVTA